MSNYRFTNKAVADLSDIWTYTCSNWSEKQADLYYKMLINFCKEIAKNPLHGKKYEGIGENIYGLKAGKHMLFYQIISTETIKIIRILHERMDLKNKI